MRFVYRNRKVALFGLICLSGVMMILIKYTEFSPTCLFREEQAKPMMLRDEVSSILFSDPKWHSSNWNVSIEIHGRKRSKLLSISSANAIDIHRRCAKIGHDAYACDVGCTSRRPVWPRNTRHSTYSAVAVTLAEIREGEPSPGRGRHNQRGNYIESASMKLCIDGLLFSRYSTVQ